ncbi:MAG: discoidin domain-containing protein [Acidobacteriota bacterium]|nr:discoidin domain-containing protein [Acidobacteriota bacterium]
MLLLSDAAAAQSNTDGTTPAAITPGAPAGSYALSGFDNINLFNGNLNFSLPLLNVRGRGGAQHTVTLPVEQHWRVERFPDSSTNSGYYYPSYNVWYDVRPGYGPGVLLARTAEQGDQECSSTLGHVPQYELTRLTFVAPDGTEYELHDKQTAGRPLPITDPCLGTVASRGRLWTTPDGQSLTFIADSDSDLRFGYLLLRDGTRYRIENEVVAWLRDRNGNKISFTYDQFRRVKTITDSLNRVVTVEYDIADVSPYGTCDRIRYRGFGNLERIIRVSKGSLSNRLRPGSGYAIKTTGQLFNNGFGGDPYATQPANLPVTAAVWLPDGRSYQFYYNEYGELARVVLPTGGAFEYDYAAGVSDGPAGGLWWPDIYRRVVERRVYAGGGTGAAFDYKMKYSRPETQAGTLGFVQVEHQRAGGVVLSKDKHYFYGSAAHSPYRPGGPLFEYPGITYGTWNGGKEYRTEALDAAGAVLRRVEHTWQQRAPVSWWSSWVQEGYDTSISPPEPANDPRLVTTVTTVEPGGANLVLKQTAVNPQTGAVGFDQFNNQTDVWEYDFGIAAAGALLRRTHTDFVTVAAYINADAAPSLGAHLRSLPAGQWVSSDAGGATKLARTTYEYDNYASDSRHAPLVARAGITGHDPAFTASFTVRGNVTGVTSYADAATPSGPVTASTLYDVAGNPVKTVNGRGHVSHVGYTDSFSDGVARNTYAFPTSTTSPVPDPTGVYGSATALTTSAVYDVATGLARSATDANGRVTAFEYSDLLDRPTRVNRPDGGWTSFFYDDDHPCGPYVRTDTLLDAAGRVTSNFQFFDRLGRPVRTFRSDPQDAAKPYLTADTQYDALGRVWRVSSQYRSAGCTSPVNPAGRWAETTFDALGRPTQGKTTADNAVVTSAYSGNQITVTDQAGKQRRSVTDALGRLTRVVEDPAGLAYATDYAYDALGSLRKVTQGSQLRFFAYDSLGRLIRAKNSEQGVLAADADFPALTDSTSGTANSQWSVGYKYDASGNLAKRKDARGVTATYTYDALNRNTAVGYSDATPDVTRTYDGATLGRGRAWRSEAAATARTTISEYDAVGRPKSYSQQFWAGSAWGTAFAVSRAYDRAGNVTSQTYPSGRAVSYTYDAAGRLAAFSGNLGDGAQRTYASEVRYHEMGGMEQERYGAATSVYNKHFYNVRGQLSEVRVSTQSILAADPGHWNRGAILNVYSGLAGWTESREDNNGNLRKQMVFVPNDDSISGWWETAFFYDYDSLNRLFQAREARNNANQWVQYFNYDRWGNRTINAANTTNAPEPQFTASAATNRLAPPAGFTMNYDAAGNLTYDNYTGAGTRGYDAEGRMTSAQFVSGQLQTAVYAYDSDGRRVRRGLGVGGEVWQVYGMDGELLAEYASGAAPHQPLKEYGYRGGELLITLEAGQRSNVALSSKGAMAAASSTFDANRAPAAAINGDRRGLHWASDPATGSGWHDATQNVFPDWLEVTFAGPKTISEVDVFSVQDDFTSPIEPTEATTFTLYGLTAFDVQYWTGSAWATVPGGSVAGNNKVWRKFTFPAVTTSKVRVVVNGGGSGHSRIAEVEAYEASASGQVRWLVTDHLGTPRMIINQSGSLNEVVGNEYKGVVRHDYLPFGEEILAGVGGRTTSQGYSQLDGVRMQFTGKERDAETRLDYLLARYYASTQGRFTSPDPLLSSGTVYNPQTWNRYAYTINNPLKYTDPFGMYICNGSKDQCKDVEKGLKNLEKARDSFKKGSDEHNRLDRSLKAYGAKGVDNGVTIEFRATKSGGPAATEITVRDKDQNGVKDVTADNPTGQGITVQIDPAQNKSAEDYVQSLGHEGSHVADGTDLVGALPTNLTDPAVATIINGPLNLTDYVTETKAYEVSSFIAQARGASTLSVGKKGGNMYEIWNSGWSQADRATKRAAGIDKVLAEPKSKGGLYEVTRANQGDKLIQ